MAEMTIYLHQEDLDRIENILYGLSELEKSTIIEKGLKDATAVLLAEGKKNLKMSLSRKPVNVRSRTGKL